MAHVSQHNAVTSPKDNLRRTMRNVRKQLAPHAKEASEQLADVALELLGLELSEREAKREEELSVNLTGKYDEPSHIPIRKTLGDLWSAHPTNNASLAAQLSPTRTIAEAEAYAEELKHALPAVPPDVRKMLGLPTLEEELAGAEAARIALAERMPDEPASSTLTLGVYSAIGTELSLRPLVRALSTAPDPALPHIRFVAPIVLDAARMEFVEVTAAELLDPEVSSLAFLIDPKSPAVPPLGRCFVSCTSIDVLFVPGLAFGLDGARLGYGAGYYDRYLAMLLHEKELAGKDMGSWPQPEFGHNTKIVGVCFAEQLLGSGLVPAEKHDQPLNCIITPQGISMIA